MLRHHSALTTRLNKAQSASSLFHRFYSTNNNKNNNNKFDVVFVGGGHNGLVCANYLLRENPNLKVGIFEKRYKVGGAAISENHLLPEFTYSRASYLCALLRPQIIEDFKLMERIEFLPRNPSSFTPLSDHSDFLMLGSDSNFNKQQIAKFSARDAEKFEEYEAYLSKFAVFLEHLLDQAPIDMKKIGDLASKSGSLMSLLANAVKWSKTEDGHNAKILARALIKELGVQNAPEFFKLMTSPASKILNEWFESDILKATLSTDSVIGEFCSPHTPGSAYVLMHHVMGDIGYGRGVWAYVRGGMGSISQALKDIALENGANIECDSTVTEILTTSDGGKVTGIRLADGRIIESNIVVSNLNAYTTFVDLLKNKNESSEQYSAEAKKIDFNSATFKINLAVDRLPNFKVMGRNIPSGEPVEPGPEHRGTIHFEDNMDIIDQSYLEAKMHGRPSSRPLIEMTIPSALDNTISPPGKHVVQLFVQYAPYQLSNGESWADVANKKKFADSVYRVIEHYAPGFTESIIPGSEDLLSPLDLEEIFSLKGGNIFHGSIRLDQLYFNRPVAGYTQYDSPISGLYLCGASCHPGGGVMGAPGRNASQVINKHLKQ